MCVCVCVCICVDKIVLYGVVFLEYYYNLIPLLHHSTTKTPCCYSYVRNTFYYTITPISFKLPYHTIISLLSKTKLTYIIYLSSFHFSTEEMNISSCAVAILYNIRLQRKQIVLLLLLLFLELYGISIGIDIDAYRVY